MLLALLCAVALGMYSYSSRKQSAQFSSLGESFWKQEVGQPAEPIEHSQRFAALTAQNGDIVGWVYVPGSRINYPVMHTPTDPEYYLRRSFEKEYAIGGTPFLDARCQSSPPSANSIIYGHHMQDGSMFSDLSLYRSPEYQRAHPVFYYYSSGEMRAYRILSVIDTRSYQGDGNRLYAFVDETQGTAREAYLQLVREASLFEIEDAAAPTGGELVTLSTCAVASSADDRLLVVGVLTDAEAPVSIV